MPQAINRETVSGEALFILKNLKENGRLGRSNKLADVKSALEPAVSLEFDTYFFFLRKFHYIAMDREAQLKLTDTGERVVDGDYVDKFASEIGEFFADQFLSPEEKTHGQILLDEAAPPPPPTEVLVDDTDAALPVVPRSAPPPPLPP